jgi:hypothetical protein
LRCRREETQAQEKNKDEKEHERVNEKKTKSTRQLTEHLFREEKMATWDKREKADRHTQAKTDTKLNSTASNVTNTQSRYRQAGAG